MRIHPVFHVSLLEHTDSLPPLVTVGREEEYSVDDVLDSRVHGRRRMLQYHVKWTGIDNPTWEMAKGVNGLQAIERFHALYPGETRPLTVPPA